MGWWLSLVAAYAAVSWERALPLCSEARRPPLALTASERALQAWNTRLVRRPHRTWCVRVAPDGTRRVSEVSWSDPRGSVRWPTTRRALTATTPGLQTAADHHLIRGGMPMLVDIDGVRFVHDQSAAIEPVRPLGVPSPAWRAPDLVRPR